jgi:hypothetical protein
MVAGRITKLVTFGAFARIDGPVEGLIHVSELVDRRINHPREVVKEGDILPLRIVRIERDRHRLGLSLRAARDEAEGVGWEFTDDGAIRYVPDEIREEVEARTGGPSMPDSASSEDSNQLDEGEGAQVLTGDLPEEAPSVKDREPAEDTESAVNDTESAKETEPAAPPLNGSGDSSTEPAPTNGGQATDRERE